MLRKLVIAALAAGALAAPVAAQPTAPTTLMPGVTYTRQVQFTPRGPVVLDVVTAPRPDGTLYALAPAVAHNALSSTETLTGIEKDASATETSVGVNGDFFASNHGPPTGIVMANGALTSAPISTRSSVGIAPNGALTVAQVSFDGTWRGTGQRRQLDLNDPPVSGHTTLYTPAWGAATPPENGVVEDVIQTLPPLLPNHVLTGTVVQQNGAGGTPIPPAGAVLVSRGAQAPHLSAEAPVGTTVEIRPTLTPDWSTQLAAIGGGPVLVSGGKAVFRANEAFDDAVLNARSARSAVGQLRNGQILLVTVEGGGSDYSAGMTNYELAEAMVKLGAVTAMGLGSGTPAGMAFDGTLLTRPSTKTEQPIADALLLSYTGVYAAPPSSDVVSPNGDGVDDSETFTYKLVSPSQVSATLTGPGGAQMTLAQDAEQPGLHTLAWNGQPATEGLWRFVVTGTDAQNRTTTAERDVLLDNTLGNLAVTPSGHLAASSKVTVIATFNLSHSANVTATIETRTGVVVDTLVSKTLQPGAQAIPWNGRIWTGGLAFTGAYQVHVVASNSIGTTELIAPFVARR